MTTYVPPTALPAAVLQREDMQAAIRAHDFGKVFSLARAVARISFAKIAVECDIKPERVGQLARGTGSITSFGKICVIADALRIPGHLLGLAPRAWETGTEQGGEHVRRRDFFKTSATAGLTLSALTALAPPLSATSRLSPAVPVQLRERTARLRRLDDVLGGGDTYRLYLREYQTTKTLLRDHTYSQVTGKDLHAVLAEQSQQAGWAAFDAGQHADAAGLYRDSRQAACEADDAALAGNALAFLAYQQLDARPEKALDIAVQATVTAGRSAPPAVRALLNERLAWAYAVSGQPADTERALADAEQAVHERDRERPVDWAAWVDADELEIMKGRCWTELRRPLRAVPILEAVLERFDDTHARDKSLYLSWLAESYLAAGEVEHAATITGRVLHLCHGVNSVRPRQRISSTLNALAAHRGLPEVDGVLEQARA
ncbi:XRE family transcriptional regulator [Streptomyces sp. NPDC050439]|uniref:XRE family transcriptional regulator n=1 Tax=unclassified Streptomyces TaxID=2593676 RepID=UPI00343C7AAE